MAPAAHDPICDTPHAGGCFLEDCPCWCHRQLTDTGQPEPAAASARSSRFVDQTILAGDPSGLPGNCHQAAVASLLGLPLDHVPHFVADHPTWEAVDQAVTVWAASRGLTVTHVDRDWLAANPYQPAVVWGSSAAGVTHSVVAIGLTVVHDPHPSRAGLADIAGGLVFTYDATALSEVAS